MSQAYIKFMTNLNSILKDKSIEEITNILPNIKTMIIRELDMIATEYNLSDDDRKLFIEQKIKEFKIKGLPLEMYEKSWEEKNHFLQDYKEMYDVLIGITSFRLEDGTIINVPEDKIVYHSWRGPFKPE